MTDPLEAAARVLEERAAEWRRAERLADPGDRAGAALASRKAAEAEACAATVRSIQNGSLRP